MQEINGAGQESSVRSSPIAGSEEAARAILGRARPASEDAEGDSPRRQPGCRVCGGLVERPRIVCPKCWHRDRREQRWESFLEFGGGDDPAPGKPADGAERACEGGRPEGTPILVVLCGPSHAGKSTFARRLGNSFTIVSSDEIRKRLGGHPGDTELERRVWHAFESAKCRALKEGRNVVLDACHMPGRARWHSLQGVNARYRKVCVVFDLPLRTVRERCLGEKRVPLREVERMWRAFQRARPGREELKLEGFEEACFVRR